MQTKQSAETSRDVSQEDLDAIELVHRRDVAATKAGDTNSLKSLMDAKCIVFPPDCEPMGGQAYLDQAWPSPENETQPKILELEQDWQELIVFGDFAYEQGLVRYAVREKNGDIIQETQRLTRILRRQSNRDWLVYRAFWHAPRRVGENMSA